MTDQEKTILKEFLSKTLKMDDEAVSGLFNADGELTTLDIVLTAYDERIAKFRKESDDKYSRGKKEALSKFEKEIREQYEVDDATLIGIDLITHVVESNVEKAKAPEVTDFTKHPDYPKFKRESEKAVKDKELELTEKIKKLEVQHQQAATWTEVERRAMAKLEALNPILPEDATKAANWKKTFLNELKSKHYKVDGDEITILNEDGTPADDGRGNLLKFEEVVTSTAGNYFDFKKATDRSSAGNNGGTGGGTAKIIKTQTELTEAMKTAKTPEERAAIGKSYRENKTD